MKTFNILPKARWLVTITLLLSFCIPNVWGAEGDVLKTYNTNSSTFTTGYKRQSGDNFVWWGQKNYLGANNATNHGNLKPTAADLPVVKAQNASATTSTTGLYYCYTSEAVANVGALEIYLSAKSGSSTVNAYIVTSSTAASSGSATWTKVTLSASSANAQGKNVNSAGTYRFTFNATETGAKYYGVVFATSSYWRATGFQMKLIEGASAGCSNAVALSKGTATNGTVNTISSASVATCSGTASDRRVTITITPDDCYDAPTNLTWTKTSGTVSASKQSGPTDNGDGTYSYVYQFAQNDNGAGTFGVTCTAKAAGKTVNFDAGPGSCLTSSLTETCDGSGVTLPAVTATGVCKGWTTFAGWATAAVGDSTTTSGVTLYAAGDNFVPASNGQTLYAVYSKSKGGGGFKLSLVASGTTYYVGQKGSGNYLSAETSSANAAIFTYENGYLYYDDSGTKKYISITGNNTNLYVTTDKPAVTWTESGTTTFSYLTSAATRYLAYNGSASPVRFASYNNNSSYPQYFTKHSTATTYYCSDPNCCTQLASINGSISWSNAATAVVSWDNLDHVNSWTVKYKTHAAGAYTTWAGAQSTAAGRRSVTITGLTPCTDYDFQIIANPASGYCDKDQTIEDSQTHNWTVSSTISNVTASPAIPTTTCSGFSTTITPAGGYELPNTITVTNADYTWNSSTGALTVNNVTGNVAITITGTVAAYFSNGATVFVQAESSSAWDASACVKAWFNASGAGGAAQTTYWLFDATDGDAGKKLYATIVPASGDLNQVTLQRFASNCSDFWNNNGTLTKASDGGSNTFRSTGSGTSNVAWNISGITLSLYGDPNSWGSSLGTFADQGNGVWTATYDNYAPANAAGESQEFKISTNYNGWIGNTGSNNNATLDGMHVGSTYNVTATLNVTTHALTMSKTFVKGTVHFNLQGHGSAISDLTNVAAGSKISAPSPAPSATGWDFGGWFKEPACTNAWDFANDVVNETMTLYAKWTKHTYTITSTLNNCSSSPAIPSSYEYTGSAASLSYTITPSSGYRLPTTITVSGTTYTWNSTTGALVLTGTIASNVTITISAVQTHTVDWYVGGSAPANKIGDDGQTTVVDHGGKIEDFPATTPDGSACDKTFVGWTNTTSYTHGTSLLFNDVAGSPTINADASFYAVFAEVNSVSASLTKMTADDDLEVGDKIVIIAQDTRYGMYQASASSYVSYWTTTDMDGEPSLSEIEADDKKYLDVAAGGVTDTWKLGDATNGYLYNSSSTNLEFSTTNSSNLTLIKWTDDSFTLQAGQYISCRTDLTGANANKWRGAGASCDPENDNNCSGTEYYYLYKYVPGGTTYTGHTINCADCGTSVTPTYTAAPTGGTVSVTKSASPVTSGSTVKTCTAVDLTVTITPASHYTLTGFTATGLSTGTATISPAVNTVVPTTSAQTFTVTVSAGATGTLNLTLTLEEDAHKVINWVVHGSSASIADGHGTTWVYSGENLTAIPDAPDAPTGCDDKVFVGWSENDRGATEEDASYYDDLFTMLGGAPTGITTDKTFTAVFATPAAGLGGTVIWDEPFDGDAGDQPSSPTSGATVYGSASIAYNCASTTYCKLYTDNLASGGAAAPELLVPKSSRSEAFEVTGIPTAGQTELTLTYMAKDALSVTTGTSGVTVGDASADGKLYTRTITIDQSGLGVASFGLTFAKSTDSNSRLDDIHLVVPGSSSMSGYVTTCEDTWTVTYYKNTEDAVTNLPSPTGISKSTGSGTLSSKVPVRYGYTFDGWATSAGGSVVYAAGAAVSSVSADMDLYAKWSVTPVTEINLSKTSLDKYVGDPSVTLSVLSVLPDGANTSVTWSSSNSSIATVNSSTGEVNFVAEGTANIIATSTITSGTTATCVVTVWAKPTVSFLDNLHSLTEDKDGNALSGYNLTDVAGTPVVFPILANQSAGSGTCEDEHYVFVGWTTSDNNTDPEDHLVTSHNLTNGDNITYYAVWADGVAGTTYTKLTNSTFKTSPAKYVIGAEYNGTTRYFYSCEKTDKNNSWGYVTADLASNTPIEFTLSGTAAALVATSTEVSARYLKPLATKDFQLSASSQTVELKSDGTIYNNNVDETDWRLLYNMAGGLRWYSSTVSGSASAYFYEVVAGGEVNYRTSCCADKVAAPTVTATKTSTTVTLTWAAVSGATGYELQWNGGAWTAATSGVVKSDLTPNTNYSWRVRATYVPPKCGADIASGSTTTNQVYHVTYAGGSGTGTCNATGSTTDATAYEAGATVTLKANGFTLVGHTFDAWTEDDEDITISSNQFTMPEHDVVITATWTPKVDKFYDRMHDGTDASHGGIADGDGKYYITREGCSYTVPSLTDNTSGATACHTKHYVLMGWTAESHLNSDGTLKTGHEGYVYTGGGTQTATGATYYAVWAEVEE